MNSPTAKGPRNRTCFVTEEGMQARGPTLREKSTCCLLEGSSEQAMEKRRTAQERFQLQVEASCPCIKSQAQPQEILRG